MSFYVSTRDPKQNVTSKQAILNGISPDGGLYVLPDLDNIQLDMHKICEQSYQENAVYILSHLLPDFTKEELEDCVSKAYTNTFSNEKITPVRKVNDVFVLELFHGPTSAFKDVALTLLPQLMQKALKTTNQKALILTATSGDTGKAALSGFCDVENIGIQVFYPDQKVSAIQYRQMVTQKGDNVGVVAVRGNFDDAQTQVKNLFLDEELKTICKEKNILLTSANSINIGRLVPQIVYYFDAYKQLIEKGVIQFGDKISFSVPTGNFGDVLAGYYAYLMGLPVKKFLVCSNANDVLTEFLTTGVYDCNRDFIQTISPSMDILVSSNLERLLYYASGKDSEKVANWMNDLKRVGKYQVDDETFKNIQALFGCGSCSDEMTKETIHNIYKEEKVVLDPHSAIAYRIAKEDLNRPMVALATASPYKFTMDVVSALQMEASDEWDAMQKISEVNVDPIPVRLKELQDLAILHKDVIEVSEMKELVVHCLEELV